MGRDPFVRLHDALTNNLLTWNFMTLVLLVGLVLLQLIDEVWATVVPDLGIRLAIGVVIVVFVYQTGRLQGRLDDNELGQVDEKTIITVNAMNEVVDRHGLQDEVVDEIETIVEGIPGMEVKRERQEAPGESIDIE